SGAGGRGGRGGPEPVVVRAEEVRVDRADAEPLRLGEPLQLAVVVDRVPRDVQRDARAAAGQAMHERGVRDALVRVASGPRPRVDVEARPRVAVAPRRRLDLELAQPREGFVLVHDAESAPSGFEEPGSALTMSFEQALAPVSRTREPGSRGPSAGLPRETREPGSQTAPGSGAKGEACSRLRTCFRFRSFRKCY